MASKDEIYASPRELIIGLTALTLLGCVAITRDGPPFQHRHNAQHLAAAPEPPHEGPINRADTESLAKQAATSRAFELAQTN